MKNTKTTLMKLTKQYRSVLKKCFLINLGMMLIPGMAHAVTINENVSFTEDTYFGEGGNIDITGSAKLTFNGGNGVDESLGWVDDESDPAGGHILANDILAENINMQDNAEMTISQRATLKTVQQEYTDGDGLDFSISASNIHLYDNSQLNLAGALRANVVGDKKAEEVGTLNILSSTALVRGSIDGV